MKKITVAAVLMGSFFFGYRPAAAAVPFEKAWGLSLNYPGIGLRYNSSERVALEARGQFDSGITAGGLRVYYYLVREHAFYPYLGIEGDFISFTGPASSGTGSARGAFIGGEYRINPTLTLQADFGPSIIALKDKDSSVAVEGVEFIVNIGVTWYFIGGTDRQ